MLKWLQNHYESLSSWKSKIKNAMEKHQIESFTIEQSIQLSSRNNKTKTSHRNNGMDYMTWKTREQCGTPLCSKRSTDICWKRVMLKCQPLNRWQQLCCCNLPAIAKQTKNLPQLSGNLKLKKQLLLPPSEIISRQC